MIIDEAVQAVKSCNSNAFRHIIREFGMGVRVLVSMLLWDKTAVDDAVQETFIYVFEHISEYEPDTQFQAWINAVARNIARKYQKQLSREAQRQEKTRMNIQSILEGHLAEAHAKGSTLDRMGKLKECVQKLHGKVAYIIQERFFRNRQVRDIAEQMEITPNVLSVNMNVMTAIISGLVTLFTSLFLSHRPSSIEHRQQSVAVRSLAIFRVARN